MSADAVLIGGLVLLELELIVGWWFCARAIRRFERTLDRIGSGA